VGFKDFVMAALTLADYRSFVKHALSGDPNVVYTSVNVTKDRIINQAGRHMTLAHPWKYLERPILTMTLTAQQNFMDLPVDFGHLESLDVTGGSDFTVSPTTMSYINSVRSESTETFHSTLYAISWPGQNSRAELQPNPRLEFYPDVSASTSFKVHYRAGWSELSESTDVPNIPITFEHLFQKYIRAFAMEQDDEQEQAIDRVDQSSVFRSLVDSQSRISWDHGPVRGGAAQRSSLAGAFISGPAGGPT